MAAGILLEKWKTESKPIQVYYLSVWQPSWMPPHIFTSVNQLQALPHQALSQLSHAQRLRSPWHDHWQIDLAN